MRDCILLSNFHIFSSIASDAPNNLHLSPQSWVHIASKLNQTGNENLCIL